MPLQFAEPRGDEAAQCLWQVREVASLQFIRLSARMTAFSETNPRYYLQPSPDQIEVLDGLIYSHPRGSSQHHPYPLTLARMSPSRMRGLPGGTSVPDVTELC